MVYRATVTAGYSGSEMVASTGDLGATPIGPDESGHWKIDDAKINGMRSSAVTNDINVRVFIDGSLLGESWHPNSCEVTWSSAVSTGSDCGLSTRSGASATDYTRTAHDGALTRWYVDWGLGYILPYTHIGPISGGTSHGSSSPTPYCTFYDSRACPRDSAIEVWVY